MGDNNLSLSLSVLSYPAEMFNDALFNKDEGNKAIDEFQKRRYYRQAILNFCASV